MGRGDRRRRAGPADLFRPRPAAARDAGPRDRADREDSMSAVLIASALPPAVARSPLVIRYDLMEAAGNIDALADELQDDGGNRSRVSHRIKAEMDWLRELLAELESAP